MSNVVTMDGCKLMTAADLLADLAARDDVAHVVVVAERDDGMSEVWYSRQQANQVVFAAKVLDTVAWDLAGTALATDDDG